MKSPCCIDISGYREETFNRKARYILRMTYVYILRSMSDSTQTYIGVTTDLGRRLQQHNTGQSAYTKQFMPWKVETYIAFSDAEKAKAFERYLKMGGGWRFAQRRLI